MRLVALYKTWDGGEFVDASLASIYDSVTNIVMVHSETSWLGERGNTVREHAVRWCEQFDTDGKVTHISVDTTSQEKQYATGVEYIRRWDLGDVIMVVDADEVWESKYIDEATYQIEDNESPAYRCNMHTYLKSPFFRVSPPCGSPTAFVRDFDALTRSPRGCQAPARQLSDVWMHHYTYVRASRELVERKLHQSAKADGGEKVVKDWMTEIYDHLPCGNNLHAFARWRSMWQSVEKIWTCDMPSAMRKARLLPLWLPQGHMLDGELSALRRLAAGKYQAVDLGTYKGLSAACLSTACKRVHTVDCYEDLPAGTFADTLCPERYETELRDYTLEENQALATRLGNVTVQAADVAQAGHDWGGPPVDILLVDADHSEEATMRATLAWLPRMRDGATVVFHDDNSLHPGVQSAIAQLCDRHWLRRVDPGPYAGSLAACVLP